MSHTATFEVRLAQLRTYASRAQHGTRGRYMVGCRCLQCRAANSNYCVQREHERQAGDTRSIVSAFNARAHMLALSRIGIGYKAIADASGVACSVAQRIFSGDQVHIRQDTERRILATDEGARADGSLVDGAKAWRQIESLLEDGYTKQQLAHWLGYKGKTLQLRRGRMTARNASRIERLARLIEEGKLKRP
jgi:hypothetical protein